MRPCARRTVAVGSAAATSDRPGLDVTFRLRSGRGDRPQARRAAVEVEGAEGVEARMVGAVEVGRAGAQQAALLARARGEQRLLARVGDVEGLDAVPAMAGEAV